MNRPRLLGTALCVVCLSVVCGWAQSIDKFDYDETVDYNIVYQVTQYEVETIKEVNITGLEEVKGRVFLVLRGTVFGTKKKGYVLLDVVLAILPVGVERERDSRPVTPVAPGGRGDGRSFLR